jgi:hypothetical protein
MKLGDMIFWGFLAAIAMFYLLKGNAMYEEKHQILDNKMIQPQEKEASH